jgi:predicted aspartyl protease
MIQGQVNGLRQATISLRLEGPTGKTHDLDFLIDTGCSEELIVTPMLQAALDLPVVGTKPVLLVGTIQWTFTLVEVIVHWHGQARLVRALLALGRNLVGTMLLEGSSIQIDMTSGGIVQIDAPGLP